MSLTVEQRAARSARSGAHYHAKKARGITPPPPKPKQAEVQQKLETAPCYNPVLTKPVHVSGPLPPMSEAERARLHSELLCLKRERDTTQESIDYLLEKLAA